MESTGRRALRARWVAVVVLVTSLVSIPSLFFMASASSSAASVWFADHKTLKRIDPQTNVLVQSLSLHHKPEALAVDPRDGSLWALEHKRLVRFNADGNLAAEIELRDVARWLNDPAHLALNPHDGSLWVGGHKGLVHLDREGRKLTEWQSKQNVRALALDADDSLWVLTKKELVHLTAQASVKETVDLKPHIRNHRYLAVDGLGGALWVASPRHVLRFNLLKLTEPPQRVAGVSLQGEPDQFEDKDDDDEDDDKDDDSDDHHGRLLALATHPTFGTLWVLTGNSLRLYDRSGGYLRTVDLKPHGLGRPKTLAFDPATPALWLAGKRGVGRFTGNGEFVAKVAAEKKASTLGVAPFQLTPTLALIEPADGSRTRNASPIVRLGLGAECSGIPCSLGETYLRSFTFDADLNGQAVGPLFSVDGAEAQMQPASRLPEGENAFSAKATDLFGHASNQIASRFTVDTIPPKFLSITPADGSTLTVENATIQGSLDDPSGYVILLDSTGNGLGGSGSASFSFNVKLKPGANSFTLVAYDQAGNEARASLKLTYQTSTLIIIDPAPGSTVNTDSLTLCGTFQGPPNTGITVNGVVAVTDGNQFCVNNLPLQPGANTLTVVMTFPDGITTTQAVTVHSAGGAPFTVSVQPQSGIAPLTARFAISQNGTAAITSIVADFNGDGSPEMSTTDPNAALEYTYATPRLYRPTFTLTGSNGQVMTVKSVVVVKSLADMDAMLRGIYSGMLAQLKVGNIDGALNAITGGVREKYKNAFTLLKPNLAAVADSIGAIQDGAVGENFAEYVVVRGEKAFLIYLIRSEDGVWRIDGM